jgi:hypothetical protein
VDLVQNLNLSKQPVSPALLQLAQSDAKWHRVKHIPVGGGGGGGGGGGAGGAGRGGLGFGAAGVHQGRASVALTSSMLADSTFRGKPAGASSSAGGAGYTASQPVAAAAAVAAAPMELPAGLRGLFQRASTGSGSAPPGGSTTAPSYGVPPPPAAAPIYAAPVAAAPNNDFAANPYVAGHSQGRGKHLTQPSWMVNGGGAGVGAASSAPVPPVGGTAARSDVRQFADHDSAATATAMPVASERMITTTTTAGVSRVSRFERAAEGAEAVCHEGEGVAAAGAAGVRGEDDSLGPPASAPPARKRSRWDV